MHLYVLQNALDEVKPGDIIELGDGRYWEDVKTRVGGSMRVDRFLVVSEHTQ